MNKKIPIVACIAVALAMPVGPAAAGSTDRSYDTLAQGLGLPLSLAVGTNKSVLYTHTLFGEPPVGKLSRIDRDGSITDVYERKDWDVAGVETRGATTFFLESVGAGQGVPENLQGFLKSIKGNGEVKDIADLAAHERKHNPDGTQHYGFGPEISDECVKDWPKAFPPKYTGGVDSHPYATAVQGNTVYVADAGMNAILKVNAVSGDVSTLAVLPPRPAVVPAGLKFPIDMMGGTFTVPDCVVGHEFAFEAVPTDVEIGPDGWLYVSTLPGGPEDASLGERGAIFKVNPWTGTTRVWAENLLGPTGIAVSGRGDVYAALMFGNEIVRIDARTRQQTQFLAESTPGAVEIQGRTLYATVNALPDFAAPPPPASLGRVIKAEIRR